MRRIRTIMVITAALLLAGCGSGGDDTMELDGTTWTAAALNGASVDHAEITANFSDGTMAGSAGCNRYSGAYQISGSEIIFPGSFISTLMGCEQQIMEQEYAYLQALETVTAYEADDDRLTLFSSGGDEVIVFDRVSQDLTGTSWSILSYLDGSGRRSALTGVDTSISFDDGKISGSAGCNSMSGNFTTDGGSLSVADLSITEMYCMEPEGAMDQESAVAQALTEAAEYRIDGRFLTIWNSEGTVLLELERQ